MDKLRFKPAYNPYTEPSMEIFGYHEGTVCTVYVKTFTVWVAHSVNIWREISLKLCSNYFHNQCLIAIRSSV